MSAQRNKTRMSPMARKKICIENARKLSNDLIAGIESRYARTIAVHQQIADVCERLVSGSPPIEPTHEMVSEQGKILYPKFVAKQTVSNKYSNLIRIWSDAFFEIARGSIQKIRLEPDSDEDISRAIGGDVQEIEMYRAVIKRQLNQIKTLQQVAGKMFVPLAPIIVQDARSSRKSEALQVQLVRDWLRQLKSGRGLLKLTDAGVEISPTGRPGGIVMDMDTWHSMLELANPE